MKTTAARHAPLLESFERWTRFVADNSAMLWAAGEVIGQRTTQMATHGIAPNATERGEMQRMVAEKQTAMLEASLAGWQEWLRLSQASWLEAVRLTMRNGIALAPVVIGLNPVNALSRSTRYATRATQRSMASATRRWTMPLDTPLKIADAAFQPVRARVAANRKRLAA